MASVYPGALDSLVTNHAALQPIASVDVNNLADAINKIELELGIDPSGSLTNVVARLNSLEASAGEIDITSIGTVGTSDDTAVFNTAAIAAIAAKKWLVIPANTTVTVDTWNIPSGGFYLKGQPGAIIRHKTGAYDPLIRYAGTRVSNVVIKDLTFQGNGAAESIITAATWNGSSGTVTLTDGSLFTPSRVGNMQVIVSTDLSNFIYSGRTGNVLTGVTSDMTGKVGMLATQPGAKIAVLLNDMNDVNINGCEFYDFYGTAIFTTGCQRVRITKNRIERVNSPGGWNAINIGYNALSTDPDNFGYIWVSENYVNSTPAAAICASVTSSGVSGGDVRFLNKTIISNNILRDCGWCGISMEAGYVDEAILSHNQVYNSGLGITASKGNSPTLTTVTGAQTPGIGGNVLVNQTSQWFPSGDLQITFANGTTQTVSYTSKDSTHFNGLSAAVTFAGGEVLKPATTTDKRIMITDNLVNCESRATAQGISSVGDNCTLADNIIRSSSTGILINTGASGKFGEFNVVTGNQITIANTDVLAAASGIAYGAQRGGICANNVITRETDRTVSGMGYGILVQSCFDSLIANNVIKRPGFAGMRIYSSSLCQFNNNHITDPGSQATTATAGWVCAYSFAGTQPSSWDCVIDGNRVRYTGTGYQYNYFIWLEQGSAQEIVVRNNDARGYQTAFKLDQQSASTTVNGGGSPVTVALGGALPITSSTNIPTSGGVVTVNGTLQTYDSLVSGSLLNLSPGGTFPDLSAVTIIGNSVSLEHNNIVERRAQQTISTASRREMWTTAAPTAGTWAVGDKVWNTTPTSNGNTGWICVTAGTPGTWQPFGWAGAGGSLGSRIDSAYLARGFLSVTFDYRTFANQYTTVSQDLRAASLYLNAGDVITNLWCSISTAGAGTQPTNIWLGLYSLSASNGTQVGITADVAGSANWTSLGKKSFALTTPYTVPSNGLYAVAHLSNGVFATTAVKLSMGASSGAWQGNAPTGAPLAVNASAQATLPSTLSYAGGTEGTYVWFGVN